MTSVGFNLKMQPKIYQKTVGCEENQQWPKKKKNLRKTCYNVKFL